MRLRPALVALGVALIAPLSLAQAAEPIALTWDAPAVCPSRESVLADVGRILGEATEHHAAARAHVTEDGPHHWSLQLATEVDGASGERSMEADSCQALATALALILAWTVDPAKARAAAEAPAAPPKETVLPVAIAPPPKTPPAPPPSHALRLSAVAALSGVGDVGTMPSPDLGIEATLGVLAGPLRFELSGADWLSQDAKQSVHGSTEGAHLRLIEGAFRACVRLALGTRWEVDPCARAALMAWSAQGFAGASSFAPAQPTSTWGALGGEVLATWSIVGPLALRVSVGVTAPLTRPPFIIDLQENGTASEAQLHQAPIASGRASVGVEVHFP